MKKQIDYDKCKGEAREIIAVSLGFIASSLLLAIGVNLCLTNNWIGVFPMIVGYELARHVFIFLTKNYLQKTKGGKK